MIRMIAPNIIRLIFFNILGDLKPITDKFDDISFWALSFDFVIELIILSVGMMLKFTKSTKKDRKY